MLIYICRNQDSVCKVEEKIRKEGKEEGRREGRGLSASYLYQLQRAQWQKKKERKLSMAGSYDWHPSFNALSPS